MAIETAPRLLERERELGRLGDALSAAPDGGGSIVLIEGVAGLGKTSLLATASAAAEEAGFACRRARATELEHDFAYGVVRQLLEPTIAGASGEERGRLFDGAAALSKPLFDPVDPAPQATAADIALSILHGLYWLVNNIAASAPLALVVDDLHWSDAESLRFFNYLAPRLAGLPLVLCASTRSGENIKPELARLGAGPETTVLRPGPLSTGATATLCRAALGPDVAPEFVTACREATGGNPFYLMALLREVSERKIPPVPDEAANVRGIGPAAVAEAVLLRLSERPPAATALVRAVAVLGDGTGLVEAANLAELEPDQAALAADLLDSIAILDVGEGLEFTHPIVRESVYADIGPRERAGAHAKAAAILATQGAPEERIAAQLLEAEPAGEEGRVELLRRVAADALRRGAPAAAAAWLRRAAAEPPPEESTAEVLLELGSAELRLGAPASVEHLRAAQGLGGGPRMIETSARQLANALSMIGDADGAVAALEVAVDALEAEDRESALRLEAELAAKAQQASLEARAPAARRLERHGDLEGRTAGERLVLACVAFERARSSGTADEAVAQIEGALAGGRLLAEQELDITGPFYLLLVGLLATDALELAHECVEGALAEARARASIPAMAYLIAHRGWFHLRRGSVAEAEADAETAIELLSGHEIRLGFAFALALLIEAQSEAAEVDAAERALAESGLGEEIPAGLASNELLRARGRLRIALGRKRDGLDDLVEFGRRDALWGAASPLASRWRSRACLALAAIGETDEARAMANEELDRARRWGAQSGIGEALRVSALLADDSVAIDRLEEAAAVLERSPARLDHARALVDLGAALRRANRRAESRTHLRQGLDLAVRCGGRSLAKEARTELRAAGGRSGDPDGTGVEQLTASERRVAELAAEGNSNPEIAQALFVTRKTVETHLGRVYRKLGISGRGRLENALREGAAESED